MPQFDLFTFSVQYLTFFISFSLFYLFNLHVILPQCCKSLKVYTSLSIFLAQNSSYFVSKKYLKTKI